MIRCSVVDVLDAARSLPEGNPIGSDHDGPAERLLRARIVRLEDALNHLLNAVRAGVSPDLKQAALAHAEAALAAVEA